MRYLVWDFDGTLAYRSGGWSRACVDVLRRAELASGIDLTDVQPHLQEGFPWHTPDRPHTDISTADEWWEHLYPVFVDAFEANGVEPEQASALAEEVRTTYVRNDWTVFDDTLPTLSRLSDAGWTNLVLSNHVPELASILRDLGITEYVEEVYCSAELGYEKPHPEAFKSAVSTIDDGATVWVIGDSFHADVDGARSVGLPAILARGFHPEAEYCCNTLTEIEEILDEE